MTEIPSSNWIATKKNHLQLANCMDRNPQLQHPQHKSMQRCKLRKCTIYSFLLGKFPLYDSECNKRLNYVNIFPIEAVHSPFQRTITRD